MNAFEERQFKVEKVNRTIDNLIEDWKMFQSSFDNLIQEILNANKREKNPLLACCGVFLTILFGLASINIIDSNTLLFYLFLDAGVAVIIFIVYGFYTWSLLATFEKPSLAIISSIAQLGGHRLGFNIMAYDITKLELQLIDNYFIMTHLINGSIKIRISNELNKIIKMKRISASVKNEFSRIVKEWDIAISSSLKIYQETRQEFDNEYWKDYQLIIKEVKELCAQSIKSK